MDYYLPEKDQDKEELYIPFILRAKDAAQLLNCSEKAAKSYMWRMRVKLGKTTSQKITLADLCRQMGINRQDAIDHLNSIKQKRVSIIKRTLFIAIGIAASTFTVFCHVVQKNYFPVFNHFLKDHFVLWDYVSPTFQRGTTTVVDPTTGKKEEVKVEMFDNKTFGLEKEFVPGVPKDWDGQ